MAAVSTFTLSAWLGGYGSQTDTATVFAHFLNAANAEIGTAQFAASYGDRPRQCHQAVVPRAARRRADR